MPSRRAIPPSEGFRFISVDSSIVGAGKANGKTVIVLPGVLSSPGLYRQLMADCFMGYRAVHVSYAGNKWHAHVVTNEVTQLIRSTVASSNEVVVLAVGLGATVLVETLRKMTAAERVSFKKIVVDGTYGSSTLSKLNPLMGAFFSLGLYRLFGDRFGGWLLDRMVEPPDIDTMPAAAKKEDVELIRRLMQGHSWLLFGDQVRFMMKRPDLRIMSVLPFVYIRCAKNNDIVLVQAAKVWKEACTKMFPPINIEAGHAWPLAHRRAWADGVFEALSHLRHY